MIPDPSVVRAHAEPEFLLGHLAPTGAEEDVWNAFRAGQEIDLRLKGTPGHGGSSAGRLPEVRAEIIVAMLCGELATGKNRRLALSGVHITGRLDLSYARIEQPIILRECNFDQPIVLAEARLRTLTLDGSKFPGIEAPNLELDGDLGLSRVSSTRTVNLTGARLHRDVRLQGAHVSHGEDEAVALGADHMVVDGSVDCHGGFEATGTVSMAGAQVNGSVRLEGARITTRGEHETAFYGDGMTVGHDFNAQGLRAEGEVRLVDVSVVSTLELRGAHLVNAGRVALRLDRAEISSSVYCDDGFTAVGEVCGIGTHVKGTVYFNKAELNKPVPVSGAGKPPKPGTALRLVRSTIEGDLGCWTEFVAHGTIVLTRASVAGQFTLATTGLEGRPAADLTHARFGTLAITGAPPAGYIDLTKAKTNFFQDGPEHWRHGDIILDEFEYTSIQMAPVTIKQREQWLSRAMRASRRKPGGDNDGYLPQPYEQLAAAYRRAGDDHAARRIQLAKFRQRNRTTTWHHWYSKISNVVQDILIGYGYAPWRALIWLLGLFAFGAVLFYYAEPPVWISAPHHSFTFGDSISYTLDLLMPISSLSDRQVWHSPNAAGEIVASALVAFGWILSATVVAGVTRVLQRT